MTIPVYEIATVVACLFTLLAEKWRPKEKMPLRFIKKWGRGVWQENGRFWMCVALSASLLFILSAFRYNVGTDYFYTYRPTYDIFSEGGGFPFSSDPGRWLIFTLLIKLGLGHVWFFFITSGVIIGLFFIGIWRQSVMPVASVALFVLTEAYFASMNGVMQYIGLAFAFFGLYYVQKQCFWKYAVFVLLGSFFHPSTIILLPLYFLSKLKLKFAPLAATGAVLVASLFNSQLKQLFSFLVSFTGYGHYVDSQFQHPLRFYPARIVIHAIVLCVALLFFYLKEDCRKNAFFRFCLYVEVIALFLMLNRNIIPLTDRVVWSLEITHILFLPMLVKAAAGRYAKAALLMVLLAMWGMVCMHEIVLLRNHEVLPYRFVYFPGIVFY